MVILIFVLMITVAVFYIFSPHFLDRSELQSARRIKELYQIISEGDVAGIKQLASGDSLYAHSTFGAGTNKNSVIVHALGKMLSEIERGKKREAEKAEVIVKYLFQNCMHKDKPLVKNGKIISPLDLFVE